MQNSPMIAIALIKATAMNKGRARVWIETDKLASFGLSRHTPINISITEVGIVVTATPDGSRKVAGRTKVSKAGVSRDIQILDICMPLEQREAIRNGASQFVVFASQGMLVISPAQPGAII